MQVLCQPRGVDTQMTYTPKLFPPKRHVRKQFLKWHKDFKQISAHCELCLKSENLL